jgi:hypothetical protein
MFGMVFAVFYGTPSYAASKNVPLTTMRRCLMVAEQAEYVSAWPEESREAAQLVIDQYGKPDEVTDTQLTWHNLGPWKRIVASKEFYQHNFPAPHIDAVESVIDYHVPVEKFTSLAERGGRANCRGGVRSVP